MSFGSWDVVTTYLVYLPPVLWRVSVGPVSSLVRNHFPIRFQLSKMTKLQAYWILVFAFVSFLFKWILGGLELYAYKYCCVAVYQRIIPILDDFMVLFLTMVNVVVGSFLTLVAMYSQFILDGEERFLGLPGHNGSDNSPIFE